MSYQIKVSYRTGDSFHTEDTEQLIEGEWTSLEVATENLNRIKGHYEWYEANSSTFRKTPNKVEKPTYVIDEFSFLFLLDDGTEYAYCPYWVGYFETLYYAEIVPAKLPKIEFRGY